ncbi:MAG: MFS transporter [Pseudomonadota bacterium]
MHALVLILAGAIGVIGSNSLVLSPIAAAVAQSFDGVSAVDIMIASAFYGAGVAINAFALAPLIDRLGALRCLILSLSLLSASLCASALATGIVALTAAQFVAGLAAGVALPATYTLASRVAPGGRESEVMGYVLTGWTLSMVAGVSGATLLAEVVGWRGVYLALTTLTLLVAASLLLGRPPRDADARTSSLSVADTPGPIAALAINGVAIALTACAAYMIAFYGLYAYVGTHAANELGLEPSLIGLVTMAYGVGFGLAAPIDRVIDRLGAGRVTLPVFATLAATYVSLGLGSMSLVVLIALSFAWGLINHLGLNIILVRLGRLAPDRRGAVMGLYSCVTYLTVFGGTLLYRPVYEWGGLRACALVSACCVLAAVAIQIASNARTTDAHE